MNRLILIGNGFDLAHGLKTSYADFFTWYKSYRVKRFKEDHTNVSRDPLLTIAIEAPVAWSTTINNFFWHNTKGKLDEIYDYIFNNDDDYNITRSPFYTRISNSIETKGWVDIENEYYKLLTQFALSDKDGEKIEGLNKQLKYLQELLLKYLTEEDQKEKEVLGEMKQAIYAPIEADDIAIAERKHFNEHVEYWIDKNNTKIGNKLYELGLKSMVYESDCDDTREKYNIYKGSYDLAKASEFFRLPNRVLLLNFNYTSVADHYIKPGNDRVHQIHIHGELAKSDNIIFGYGDELDENFNNLKEHGDKECLRNVKSIRYLETPNYRNMLSFIDSGPFQVFIMGHSCGNSDRTLLNTIFEHKNCVSIKPYFYQKPDGTDNYMELVQNISRNFNDMKLMRDRVVNKTFCEPLPQSR